MPMLTLEAIRRDPELLRTLHAGARRARAEHVHQSLQRLLGAPGPRAHRPARDRQLAELRTACCA